MTAEHMASCQNKSHVLQNNKARQPHRDRDSTPSTRNATRRLRGGVYLVSDGKSSINRPIQNVRAGTRSSSPLGRNPSQSTRY